LGNSTVGSNISFNGVDYEVQSLESFQPESVDLIIFAAGSSIAAKYARAFVEVGTYVIDLSSHFRYEEDVPLNIELINVATYQAVSGTGKAALEELHNQTYFSDSSGPPSVYPKQIAFNVIPQCDVFLDNDFTKEEMKLTWETHKILDPNIFVQATCVRVPVFNGHSEAVFCKISKNTSRDQVIKLLKNSEGIQVLDNPEKLEYPTPVEHANDTENIFVGRIRAQEHAEQNWLSLWIVADNVYGKGAALNAVQIAERLLATNKF
jgi:aspartate-semialdehyde dehydrogenase